MPNTLREVLEAEYVETVTEVLRKRAAEFFHLINAYSRDDNYTKMAKRSLEECITWAEKGIKAPHEPIINDP